MRSSDAIASGWFAGANARSHLPLQPDAVNSRWPPLRLAAGVLRTTRTSPAPSLVPAAEAPRRAGKGRARTTPVNERHRQRSNRSRSTAEPACSASLLLAATTPYLLYQTPSVG